jgi:hypothetical protein
MSTSELLDPDDFFRSTAGKWQNDAVPVWKITTRLRGVPNKGDAERLQALVAGSTVQSDGEGLILEYRNYAPDEAFALFGAVDLLNDVQSAISSSLSPQTGIELIEGQVEPSEALGSHIAAAVVRVTNIANQAERLRADIEAAGRHSKTLGRHNEDQFSALAQDVHTFKQMIMDLIQALAEVESGSRG